MRPSFLQTYQPTVLDTFDLLHSILNPSYYGVITLYDKLFQVFPRYGIYFRCGPRMVTTPHLKELLIPPSVWTPPVSLDDTNGISFDFFSSPY